LEARRFYEEKVTGQLVPRADLDLILKKVTEIKEFVAPGKIHELEAENAQLKEENARLIQNAAAPSDNPQHDIEPLISDVRLLRTDLAIKLGKPASLVFQQLCWCLDKKWGKILDDGHRYIFNTYKEWQARHFQCYSWQTVKRAFARLEEDGLVISKQPDGRRSRRKYYRLTAEGLNLNRSGESRPKRADPRAQNDTLDGSKSAVPSSERESTSNTSTRPQAALVTRAGHRNAELELLRRISELCGPEEMRKNGAMWRDRGRKEPRALRNAIEDLELRSDNYHLPDMKNPGAMLTSAFERCRGQLARSLSSVCSSAVR
jgi:DNA-binding MarR family transcriptional regulator